MAEKVTQVKLHGGGKKVKVHVAYLCKRFFARQQKMLEHCKQVTLKFVEIILADHWSALFWDTGWALGMFADR